MAKKKNANDKIVKKKMLYENLKKKILLKL